MNDPRETLNRIRKQADNATEGPWQTDTSAHVLTVDNTPNFVALCADPDYSDAGVLDAEFIAAARTTVPALLDALEKVLELHQPVTDGMGFTEDGYGGISPACSSCGTSDEYAVPYPCPTVTAITTALEATK